MGLVVINKSANYGADLPIFGAITLKKDLVFAFRPSANAPFDLSDNQVPINIKGEMTEQGLKGYGDTASTIELKDAGKDDVTVIICGRVTDLTTGGIHRAWFLSNLNTANKSGLGFLLTADHTATGFTVKLRTTLTATTSSGNAVNPSLSDITIAQNYKADKTDWLYIVYRVNTKTKVVQTQIINKSLDSSRTYTNDNIGMTGRNASIAGNYLVGASPSGSRPTANAEIAQILMYNAHLTDAQVNAQYEIDKKWLKSARNIEL